MRRFFIAAVVVLATLASTATARADATDFYRSLLRRGIADFGAGKNEQALRELRIGAFGLIDSIPDYETAQVYLALLHDRLKQEPEARLAIQRIFAAERVAPQLTTLPLDPAARSAFDALARKLLTSVDYARLHGTATAPTVPPEVSGDQQAIAGSDGTQPAPAPPSTPVPAPQPSKPPKVETYVVPGPVVQPPRAQPAPAPAPKSPAPAPAPRTPAPSSGASRPQRFADAETALMRNDLPAARMIYRELLAGSDVDHATAIRIAEGLYRARDFSAAIQAFERAGGLRKGEEPYHYYLAVALYESGRYNEAKRELAAALPFIEVTPDVERYRVRIEGALE